MGKLKELRVWVDAMDLTAEIYRITQYTSFNKNCAFANQIRRAAGCISSNIAEGGEPGPNRAALHFFNIAKGSAAELITQLNIAARIGCLGEADMQCLENLAEKLALRLKITFSPAALKTRFS